MDSFFTYLANAFGCPCNFSPIDEEMYEFCGDDCQNDETECWKRVMKMVAERENDADRSIDNENLPKKERPDVCKEWTCETDCDSLKFHKCLECHRAFK